ncbi:MAG: transposase [Gaiellaceae bacterium]
MIAETGGDMSPFASARHLASWAGMCPGNDESAGKRRSGKVGKALDLWAHAVWLEVAAPVIATVDETEDLAEALDHQGLRAAAERRLACLAAARRDVEGTPEVRPGNEASSPEGEHGAAVAAAVGAEEPPPLRPEGAVSPAMEPAGELEDPEIRELLAEEGNPDAVVVDHQQEQLEDEVLAHGDDGLLERLARLDDEAAADGPCGPVIADLRRQAASLGRALRDRELFAIGGRVGVDDAPAAKLYQAFGSIAQRTAAQDEAQRFAEVGRDPTVLIWLPDPDMRLKLARVLVDNGQHVNEFQAYEEARGGRGADIYRAHRRLWSLWIFCHRSLTQEQRDAALVYLAAKYGVVWERMRDQYGPDPSSWIARHGLSRLLGADPLDPQVTGLVGHADQVAARGPEFQTISDVMTGLSEVPEVAETIGARGE